MKLLNSRWARLFPPSFNQLTQSISPNYLLSNRSNFHEIALACLNLTISPRSRSIVYLEVFISNRHVFSRLYAGFARLLLITSLSTDEIVIDKFISQK